MSETPPDPTVPRIVILGAGFAGLTLATQLDSLAQEGLAEVVLIERRTHVEIGALYQFALKGDRQLTPEKFPMSYSGGKALKCENVKFLCDEVTAVDVKTRCVHTRSGRTDFDYLAIACGTRFYPDVVPGLATSAYNVCSLPDVLQLKEALRRHKGGRIVMSVPRTPFKCPIVPQEYLLIIETMLREAGTRESTELVFVTEADGPFPYPSFFLERFEQCGIRCIVFAPVASVDPRAKQIVFGEGRDGRVVEPMHYEILLAAYPLAAPEAFSDLCDESRLIVSDPRSLKTAWDGVYALGDCAAMRLASGPLHPKAGTFAVCQAEALAQNLIALVRSGGACDAGAENLGIGQCIAEVGNNEAAIVSINLMGGPKSRFELSAVSTQALEDKVQWIRDNLQSWFRDSAPF